MLNIFTGLCVRTYILEKYSKKYSKMEDARGYFKDVRYHIYRSYDESARSKSLSRP